MSRDEIFEILDSPMKNGNIQISQFTSISWSDLTISYDGRREIHIPAGQLLPGKIYGLIGPSGSGKSTLVDLILGVMPDLKNSIRISGLSPTDSIKKWPGAIGYVPQDVSIVPGSILENIALGFGKHDIEVERVEAACKLAKLDDFIKSLSEKKLKRSIHAT